MVYFLLALAGAITLRVAVKLPVLVTTKTALLDWSTEPLLAVSVMSASVGKLTVGFD